MNKKLMVCMAMISFIVSVLAFLHFMTADGQSVKENRAVLVGKFCISLVCPGAEWEEQENTDNKDSAIEITETVVTETKKVKENDKDNKVDNTKPQVIIYHTHSSESYQPYSESNFHRQTEEGTVRDVGNVMTAELNKLGVSVVHDKTIHDSPSYNESYDRSMETITVLMEKYPTAEVIIDLHRDAAAYTGNVGETMQIEGETVAKYKFVVGQGNDNYSKLMAFAKKVNAAAEKMYPGFSGRIIEKEYRYNEYIADNYLLLEVGNNQNNISEVRKTGKYFARVLAAVLEENK